MLLFVKEKPKSFSVGKSQVEPVLFYDSTASQTRVTEEALQTAKTPDLTVPKGRR